MKRLKTGTILDLVIIKTDYRFIAHWKDGKWDEGETYH